MTYAEELKTRHVERRKTFYGNETPVVIILTVPLPPPMETSGQATGSMWQGLDLELPFDPATRRASEIIDAVLKATDVCRRDFMSHRRTQNYGEARQIAYWFMRYHTRLSLPAIGRMIGHRDHSTVWYGIRKVTTNSRIFGDRLAKVATALGLSHPREVPFQ